MSAVADAPCWSDSPKPRPHHLCPGSWRLPPSLLTSRWPGRPARTGQFAAASPTRQTDGTAQQSRSEAQEPARQISNRTGPLLPCALFNPQPPRSRPIRSSVASTWQGFAFRHPSRRFYPCSAPETLVARVKLVSGCAFQFAPAAAPPKDSLLCIPSLAPERAGEDDAAALGDHLFSGGPWRTWPGMVFRCTPWPFGMTSPKLAQRAMGHPIRRRLAVLAKCHRQLPTPKVSAAPHYPSTPASSGARRLAVLPCHMGANLAC